MFTHTRDSSTGYIGGSVLSLLPTHSGVSASNISILVRSAEKAQTLRREFGLNAIVGSTDEHEKLQALAAEADVVFSCVRFLQPFLHYDVLLTVSCQADADDLPAVNAILTGLKTRYDRIGTRPILIHTVSMLQDQTLGNS